MKRKALLIIAALLLMLCGCAQNTDPADSIDPSDNAEITATDTVVETAAPVLQTEIADGTNEDRFECVHHVGDYGYEQNLIWCERAIENVTIIPIESEDAYTWYTDCTVVCAFDELLPSEAIKLDMMVPEGFPSHAISYYADGVRYAYSIGYNGRDGGISFSEIELVEKSKTAETLFNAYIYAIEGVDGEIKLVPEETAVESNSAWHVWAALKERNSDYIPKTAYLNSFTVDGTDGTLDLSAGIYSANLGSMFEAKMLEAIASTYMKTYGIEKLYITVDGDIYASGHFEIDDAFELSE